MLLDHILVQTLHVAEFQHWGLLPPFKFQARIMQVYSPCSYKKPLMERVFVKAG